MKFLQLLILAGTVCACRAPAQEQAHPSAFDPTALYRRAEIEGFTILINPKVAAHEAEARRMWAELEQQLKEVVRSVPDHVLPEFRKYRIWVEWEQTGGGACFHPSREWLTANGYNPEKTGDIEICHTRHFVDWSERHQPSMVLHELAHAYHHRVLGLKDERVIQAFKNAVDQMLYQAVAHVDGNKARKAYALTNEKEYFSELTEAYFGRNDFYPFNRSELKEYDPVGYQMMVDCWGCRKQ